MFRSRRRGLAPVQPTPCLPASHSTDGSCGGAGGLPDRALIASGVGWSPQQRDSGRAQRHRYGYSRYVANQTYYSLIGRDYEWELMPLGLDQRVGALVWSPLGWGRLTGRIRRGEPLPEASRLHESAGFAPPV